METDDDLEFCDVCGIELSDCECDEEDWDDEEDDFDD